MSVKIVDDNGKEQKGIKSILMLKEFGTIILKYKDGSKAFYRLAD